MNRNKKVLTIMIAVIAILALGFFVRFFIGGSEDTWICVDGGWIKHGVPSVPMPIEPCGEPKPLEPVACTQEAKQCPDGFYVARVPPNCEFAPCPGSKN